MDGVNAFDLRVSVIVPVYNAEDHLRVSLNSLVKQTMNKKDMEVLLVDDGSTDDGPAVLREYEQKHPFFRIISKQNEGVSAARNLGIREAKGKYIMYLDADDALSEETVERVVDFFDAHYDEVDLVTYKIIPVENGAEKAPHFRYKTLNASGIYDLNEPGNAYITQSTMNICVKNLGENSTFFDSQLSFHEDQKYITTILQEKMKLGYCSEGLYWYYKWSDGAVQTHKYAYYIFESATSLWEEFFQKFFPGPVPRYLQGMYLHDLNWKMTANVLFPYHYPPEQFRKAVGRMRTLLNCVDDELILNHPDINAFRKHYFLSMKDRPLNVERSFPAVIQVNNGEDVLYEVKEIEIYLGRMRASRGHLQITAMIKSPLFNYCEKPNLYLVTNKHYTREISLRQSAWGYYNTKVMTNNFWLFDLDIDMKEVQQFYLLVQVGEETANPTRFTYDWRLPLYKVKENVYHGVMGGYKILCSKQVFKLSPVSNNMKKTLHKRFKENRKVWLTRQLILSSLPGYEKSWLYYDSRNVVKDNGYYQFEHDVQKKDGIRRYYVVHADNYKEARRSYPRKIWPFLVEFGSRKHKLLYLKAAKVLASDVGPESFFPFTQKTYKYYSDICTQPELIYLQHGVLHAHIPWAYSRERARVDRQVISTRFEEENLLHNYNFNKENLIKCGMARYDFMDHQQASVNRILYAPSWRRFLVGRKNDQWVSQDKVFLESIFYQETQRFLNSPELKRILEEHDFYLDFKLHPILKRYEHLYQIQNDRVSLASPQVKETEYSVFITDYSSFLFDFVYLSKPIVYFVPDEELFRSGMSHYRELDMPLDDAFGDFALTAEDAVTALEKLLKNDCQLEAKYEEKMKDFFFYKDNNQRQRLYEALMEEDA